MALFSSLFNRKVKRSIDILRESAFFDEKYYKEEYGNILEGMNPYVHYLSKGWKIGCNPSANFSGDAYINYYTDVRMAQMNPLIHYEKFGRKENRKTCTVASVERNHVDISDIKRLKENCANKKTILLVSHEMSLTGAPRALLNMALILKKRGFCPVFLSLKHGALENEIENYELLYFIEPLFYTRIVRDNNYLKAFFAEFDVILFNTLDTVPLIGYFSDLNVKKICWLHEGKFSYDYYKEKFDLSVLFPLFDKIYAVGEYSRSYAAPYVKDSDKLGILLYGIPEEDVLDCSDKVKFLLPGSLCERKGQMILLSSLSLLSPDILEKVVIYMAGAILEEHIGDMIRDMHYSCVNYLGEMNHSDLLNFLSSVDVLLCPSLDDPMPIVCTEAMMFSKPVIVSTNTGTASFIQEGVNGYVVKAGDAEELAKAIERAVVEKDKLTEMGKQARLVYEQNFTFEKFEGNIRRMIIE